MKRMQKRISIKAADGNMIPAIFASNNAKQLVILSHGITTEKNEDGTYTRFVDEFLSPGFDSIRFDFRGHGESKMATKDVTIAGEILDLMAVIAWARKQKYSKLFHLGTSFGASITLLAAARFSFLDFTKMVFWNPVINYENTFIHSKVEWAREFFDQKRDDELAYRRGIKIPETQFVLGPRMVMELLQLAPQNTQWPRQLPLLIIHGTKDTLVPYEDAMDYCTRHPKQTTLHVLKGVDHGFDDKLEEAFDLSLRWLQDK